MEDESLGVGTDAEAVEECCFLTLACSSQLAQPASSYSPAHLPRVGSTNVSWALSRKSLTSLLYKPVFIFLKLKTDSFVRYILIISPPPSQLLPATLPTLCSQNKMKTKNKTKQKNQRNRNNRTNLQNGKSKQKIN